MATWYVYSGAAGTASGADWTNAKTTLAAAVSAGAAGDTYYLAHDHAETQASALSITMKGTSTAPDRILCVNRGGSVPPVAADLTTGASISTTGANALTLNGGPGGTYVYGVTLSSGSGSSNGPLNLASILRLDTCSLVLNTTSTSGRINFGSTFSTTILVLDNCTAIFGSTNQQFAAPGSFDGLRIRNKPGSTFLVGATIPTTLFSLSGVGLLDLSGLDLSAAGSGKTLFAAKSTALSARLTNCRLNASVTIAATPTVNYGGIDLIGCSSGGNVARNERYQYQGTLTTETTIIRTAGASDGTTAYSWKIVTTANAKRDFPFETIEGAIWNSATNVSKTLTVHTVTDNVTLTDAEIWLEVEYLGSSGTPVATLITDANATVLTTAANQASDSGEAWTTTGLTTPVKQKIEVTFTPQMAGPIRWRVKVAKASTTVYVCPKADLS